jgi:hypothetical protein
VKYLEEKTAVTRTLHFDDFVTVIGKCWQSFQFGEFGDWKKINKFAKLKLHHLVIF